MRNVKLQIRETQYRIWRAGGDPPHSLNMDLVYAMASKLRV